MVQELRKGVRLVAGVQRVAVERLGVAIGPELAIRLVLEVVEVADGGQRDRIGLVEDLVVVEQPLLVATDLDRWVEDAPEALADGQLDAVVGGRRTDGAVAPLLELDDDRVLGAGGGVAGQHRVEAAAGVAELVLEDDAVVVQLGLVDEHRQRHEAVLPARHLGRRRPMPDLGRVLGAQLLRDPMHLRIGPKLLGRPGVQLHWAGRCLSCLPEADPREADTSSPSRCASWPPFRRP